MNATSAFQTSAELRGLLTPLLDGQRHIVLLILQLPEFAQIAWKRNKRAARRVERSTSAAFLAAATVVVREGDVLAHDPGSDWFAVAMLAPARDGASVIVSDARVALERIAAGIVRATGSRMQTGWSALRAPSDVADMTAAIALALERGAREHERYEFLATVGHELRTPLTSIRGYIETLLESDVDVGTARRFLETARNEALRLGRLVDGMLEFSLLDLTPQTLLDRSSDLAEIVRGAVDALSPVARERGIVVRAEMTDGVFARIEPDACTHAVVNLIENALKYGRRGGCVEISAKVSGRTVEICVDDDGPGVTECERDAIFELRARGRSSISKPGCGIGLAIVRTIAERVAGAARVERSPLGGARFVLEIPLALRGFAAELRGASS